MVFSAWVLVNAAPVVFGVFKAKGWEAAYCDADKSMWNGTSFGYWATVFYLSKYYEFIDTWVSGTLRWRHKRVVGNPALIPARGCLLAAARVGADR